MSGLLPRVVLLVWCSVAVVLAQDEPTPDPRRPNVLFLFADDQRPDTIGAFGNDAIRTPNLDRLAESGMAFRQNFCMGSRHGAVCAPSRAMLMSGRTLHRVRDDLTDGDGRALVTMPQWFRQHGYATFGTGKWHNGRPAFERSFEAGSSVMFGGMSDHNAVPIVDLDSASRAFSDVRAGDKHSSELFGDALITWLDQRAAGGDDRPFFAYAAFTAPHDPRDPPVEFRQRKGDERPPLPPNFRGQHGWTIDVGTMTLRDEVLAAWPRDPETIRDQLAEYYGLIEHLDVQIGRILSRIQEQGLADDTIVVYAADHGLALGSHGLLGKQNLYEHSMGCPLVFAGPGVPQGRTTALTYLLDVFPTLCDLTGLAVPEGVEGASLAPILHGQRDQVRDSLFTLYRDNQRAIRDARYKLIRFTKTGKTLLFDLGLDPHETNDLAGDPEHAARIAAMLETMRDWQERTADRCALWPTDPLPMTIDLRGRARQPDRWQPEWIVEKYFR